MESSLRRDKQRKKENTQISKPSLGVCVSVCMCACRCKCISDGRWICTMGMWKQARAVDEGRMLPLSLAFSRDELIRVASEEEAAGMKGKGLRKLRRAIKLRIRQYKSLSLQNSRCSHTHTLCECFI